MWLVKRWQQRCKDSMPRGVHPIVFPVIPEDKASLFVGLPPQPASTGLSKCVSLVADPEPSFHSFLKKNRVDATLSPGGNGQRGPVSGPCNAQTNVHVRWAADSHPDVISHRLPRHHPHIDKQMSPTFD
ncbi:Trinucleotide Repeat-Containing 6A Protein [Manis pentadactyla]|nr:Trinucleotide Repeat-Containing 6A Protein [Manis pentadactyla]